MCRSRAFDRVPSPRNSVLLDSSCTKVLIHIHEQTRAKHIAKHKPQQNQMQDKTQHLNAKLIDQKTHTCVHRGGAHTRTHMQTCTQTQTHTQTCTQTQDVSKQASKQASKSQEARTQLM
jgi:hypothetical protein